MIRQRKPIPRYTPLQRSTKPLKRSPIRYKKRKAKVSWRSGRVQLDSAGMARLRGAAFQRSCRMCECGLQPGRESCGKSVTWIDGQLHHIKSRGQGGSDVIENVAFIRRDCHEEITGKLQWAKRKP